MRVRSRLTAAILALCLPAGAPAWGQASANAARLVADRGRAEEAKGMREQALLDLTQAIDMRALPAAEQARLIFDRGLILDTQGWLDDAAGDYSAAIKLAPRFAPALNNRANVYRRQNRLAEARRDYLASLTAGNAQPEYSWYGLGEVAEAAGDARAARQAYGRALAANPAYQLAAERLAALGGDISAPVTVIHLKPPKEAAGAEAGPITLKPPKADAGPVAGLNPPQPDMANMAPAHFDPGPDLRPALDDSTKAQVQLGAWRTEEEAGAGWNRAKRQAGDLLDGLSPHIVAAEVPGRGRYYRLRAGPVAGAADELCAALTARGQDCIPARD